MRAKLTGHILDVDGVENQCVRFDGKEYITIQQLAALSHYKDKTIRRKIKSGVIPCMRRGDNNRLFVCVDDLFKMIEEGIIVKYISA